jgi:RNA-directed DNA polymerase
VQHPDGTQVIPDRGTPQGSAVSPALANLFLHYALDTWLTREYPTVWFERYVDDAVVHCVTRRHADQVRAAIGRRLDEVGLRLHPTKTRTVYCRNRRRTGSDGYTPEHTSFTFLGYTFRPRKSRTATGEIFTSFAPAVSKDAQTAMSGQVRSWRLHARTTWTLEGLAATINPIVRGWINYYGRFRPSELYPLLTRINAYLMRWARSKYRRLRSYRRAKAWWQGLVQRAPALFAHWTRTTAFWGRV